jgi:hypothetical protein
MRHAAKKAGTNAVLTYLGESSTIRNLLPRSREIAEAHLVALDLLCDSPDIAIEHE